MIQIVQVHNVASRILVRQCNRYAMKEEREKQGEKDEKKKRTHTRALALARVKECPNDHSADFSRRQETAVESRI